jgi:hypothetical protein
MSEEFGPYVALFEQFVRPLAEAVDDSSLAEDLLRDLGYAPPSEVLAFKELSAAIGAITTLTDAVRSADEADEQGELLKQLAELAKEMGRAARGINDFTGRIQANFAGTPFLADTDILAAIPRKLLDYLVVRFLEDYHPLAFACLVVGGVVDIEDVEDAPTAFHVPYRKRIVNWEQLPGMFSDPLGRLSQNLEGGDELLYDRLLWLLYQLGLGLGFLPVFEAPRPSVLNAFHPGQDLTTHDDQEELSTLYFPILADPSLGVGADVYPLVVPGTGKYSGLALAIRAAAQVEFPIGDAYKLTLKASANVTDGLGFRMERGGGMSFVSSIFSGNSQEMAAATQFGLRFAIEPSEVGPSGKLVQLGAPGGVRFEVGSGSLAFGVEKMGDLKMFVEGQLNDGLLVLASGEADGFLSAILPPEGITSSFALGIGISNKAGLYFTGSSALLIRIPVHASIGPIELQYVGIRVGIENERVPVSLTVGFSGHLGPIAIAVEDMGVTAVLRTPPARDGNLGPLDVVCEFKPPSGAGLAVDAGVIKGGGYVSYDRDREEYAGALELTFSGFLSLKAIGIITTRMPDGSSGFSLLIIITAEFGPGIQLGYGFTLLGVGGLLGLHRTVKIDPLLDGVRTGAIANIMFPRDVIANAPRIISDLRAIFPPQQNVFLIGPMAKLGWGAPTLISLSLGIVIEIPGNVAILGVLRSALPAEEAPLIVLQVAFVGVIEFAKKRLFLFAGLFGSRVLYMTLDGEMGALASFGADGNLLLSVGGFHPRYSPPPLPFPVPKRLALTILNESWGRLRADGYFAVTTNTAQFGAHVDAYFGFDSFNVSGGLSFDALFQFFPFFFVIEMSAHFSIKVFGMGLYGIRIEMTLSGPSPWRAKGKGSISFFFFDISVGFDFSWGESDQTSLPSIEAMPVLASELTKDTNWQALLPSGRSLFVTLRKLPEGEPALVLHPVGTLRVSQRAVPLDLTIAKIGNQKVSDVSRLSLAPVGGGALERVGDAIESFAPAQYQELSDAVKLAKPAYEPYHGGLDLSSPGAALASGAMVRRKLRYEVVTIDTNYRRFQQGSLPLGGRLFDHFFRGASASRADVSAFEKRRLVPFADSVEAKSEGYTVASRADNRAFRADASFDSEGEAAEFLAAETARDPALAGTLHVIPDYEKVA